MSSDKKKYLRQLQTSIEVYVQRGSMLIEAVDTDNIDLVEDLYSKRKAAYRNFVVADALSGDQAESFYNSETGLRILEEIKSQEKILNKQICLQRKNAQESIVQLRKEKDKITKFRSRCQKDPKFQVAT